MLTEEKSHNSESAESRLDRLCTEFEFDWKGDSPPDLGEFLNRCPAEERARVFPHLLGLELDYRNIHGHVFEASDYHTRFPEFVSAIDRLFAEFESVRSQFGSGNGKPTGSEGEPPTVSPPNGIASGPGLSSESTSGLRRIGRYKLLNHCGRGGMGDVYRAQHPLLRRLRAVKVLRDFYDKESADRFRLEIETAEVLQHQNIVMVHDAGEDHGRLFLVMEYVDGLDLHKLTKLHKPMPIGAVCELIRQACEGLQHADEHFLVHRDIKPSNLMINNLGRVKILDFGLARFNATRDDTQSRLTTRDGALLGTVDFMAPEQWKNAAGVTVQADLYSMGCTLYYLLTGAVPFPKEPGLESVLDTLIYKQRAHNTFPVPRIDAVRDDVPDGLQDLLERMMAKSADDRPACPLEVAAELEQWASRDALKALTPAAEIHVPGDLETEYIPGGVLATLPPGSLPSGEVADSRTPTRVMPRSSNQSGQSNPSNQSEVPPTEPNLPRPQEKPAVWRQAFKWALLLSILAGVAYGANRWFNRGEQLPADVQTDLVENIQALPGLNGGWWFDEMPWLTPALRMELVDRVSDGDAVMDGQSLIALNEALRDSEIGKATAMLNQLATSRREDLPQHVDNQHVQLLQGIDRERGELKDKRLSQNFAAVLPTELASADKATTRDVDSLRDWPATRVHLMACVMHWLSRTNRAYAPLADKAYDLADEKYAGDSNIPDSLRALFHNDHARFHLEISGPTGELKARTAVEKAVALNRASLLKPSLLAFEADMLRRYHSSSPQKLEVASGKLQAATQAADDAGLHPKHPLRAEIHERHAWVALEGWHLKQAQSHFETATELRRATLGPGNQLAEENILLNDQGLAMALHFLGRDESSNDLGDGAIRKYNVSITRIKKKLDSDAPPGTKRTFQDRLPNLHERRADCFLFGHPARYSEAAEELALAVTAADELDFETSASRWGHMNRLYYKWALAILLQDEPNLESAQTRFESAAILEEQNAGSGQGDSLFITEKVIAEALLADDQGSISRLFSLIAGQEAGQVSRKNIEVLLLAIRQLLETSESELDNARIEIVGKKLLEFIQDMQHGDREISAAYLRPTLELAVSTFESRGITGKTAETLQDQQHSLQPN